MLSKKIPGTGQSSTDLRAQSEAINRSMAMIEFKTDGTILNANENFLNTVGYSLEEIQGQHHRMFMDPEEAKGAEYKAFWERLAKGEFFAAKYRRLGKGGKEIWIQAVYNPVLDKKGRPVKVIKLASDISQSEQIAREATFKSSAFSEASTAMMTIDREFTVTFVNKAMLDMFRENAGMFSTLWPGFNADTIVGTCIDRFHKNPGNQRAILSDPSRLPYKTDITLGEFKFALNVTGVFDMNGQYAGNVLEWTDVTAERTNAGILQALDRAQATIEFTLDGEIVTANENFLSTVGYTMSEVKGKHHRIFVDPEYASSAEYTDFWAKLGRGEYHSGKYRRISKTGKEIWIQASYNPILDGNGTPFKVVKFASDITEIEEERATRAAEQAQVVTTLADGLRAMSEGNLTHEISDPFAEDYEQLRLDFNAAISKLRDTIQAVIVSAGTINNGAGEITNAAEDLARRTERQAATLEEAAASLEEITSTVHNTADGAQQANTAVTEARGNAETSGEVVSQAVEAMTKIEKSSDQISQIIGVIDEIAFQTNLLALNAGVEAARAGEAGKGFAVVASEVRALAQRSSEAAKEIKELISTSGQHVKQGVDLVGEAGNVLQEIVGKVVDISALVSTIASSAQEQATSLKEVNTAVNQMDQVTQQNASMVEQSTSASRSLTQEATEMTRLVSRFRTGEEGAFTPSQANRPNTAGQAPIAAQQDRVRAFAAAQTAQRPQSDGNAALAQEEPDDETWQDF